MSRLPHLILAAMVAGSSRGARAVADPPCPSDLDGSRLVDTADLSLLLLEFGDCGGCASDADQNGFVDTADLSLMLLDFGDCPRDWYRVLEQSPDPVIVYDAGLRAAITATGLPWRVCETATGIEMVLIPPGTFTMGCDETNQVGWYSDESPSHQVTLTHAFYLGRTEVTQAQWEAVMGCNPSYFQSVSHPSGQQSTGCEVPLRNVSSRPVEQVSWNDTQSFCTSAGFRLPTEAEWEYAYRAGTTRNYHGWAGNPGGTDEYSQIRFIAWVGDPPCTRPAGGKAANGFGLYDMAGNVYEWVNDWYGSYSIGPTINPAGSSSGDCRILRGGCWDDGVYRRCYRASGRLCENPDSRSYFSGQYGFRVAKSP